MPGSEREARPRFLAVGHVCWDRIAGGAVLGGVVSYAGVTASRLGFETAILTAAGADFEPFRELPEVAVFVERSAASTRFVNEYTSDGARHQTLLSRAGDVSVTALPKAWRAPDVLLLGPVAGEVGPGFATAIEARLVGATAQGWLRDFLPAGDVVFKPWAGAARDLQGVHVLFLSEHDLPGAEAAAGELLHHVPIVVMTRGWRGLTLLMRHGRCEVPGLPRPEVDPTGAGDVLAAAFLVRYHETNDPLEAAAFAVCAASCAVEAVGTAGIADRAEIERRLALRERLLEEGEWDE